MKGYLKYLVFIFFIIICGLVVFFYINSVENGVDIIYNSEILIVKDGVEYEVKTDNIDKYTIFRENDVEEVIYKYPRTGKTRIALPNLDNVIGRNVIDGKEPFINYTYNVSFNEGYSYLKFLLNEGYNIVMYVSSPQYLEVFFFKDDLYKRIILFEDSLMVCDMIEGAELPPVWEYLKQYNYNNYIETKFNVDFENKKE